MEENRDAAFNEAIIQILIQSEGRYRTLLEHHPDLISLCDKNGRRIYVNASYCSFSGKTYDELIGTHVLETTLTGFPKEVIEQAFRLTPDSPEISHVSELTNARNERVWIHGRSRGLFDPEGNLHEILTIGRDVTGLKKAELDKSSYINDLERIAFLTSHKIRGPIASMLGLLELLRLNMIRTEEWNELLESFRTCILNLDNYSKEMASFIYRSQAK